MFWMGMFLGTMWSCFFADNDKWNPHPLSLLRKGTGGKADLQEGYYEYNGKCDYYANGLQDRGYRPMPVTILRRQGIHPHPGPNGTTTMHIKDDPCWEAWGMSTWADGDSWELRATCGRTRCPH